MIEIGAFQKLVIKRREMQGFYLEDPTNEETHEVLFPRKYITDDMAIGDEIDVFVYCDSYDMDVATTEKPVFTIGQFALLEVKEVTQFGAFCDWGLSKDLLIPFRNQHHRLESGQKVVVHLYLDDISKLLVGTTKIRKYLTHLSDEHLQQGQKVDLLVYGVTEMGYKVIINHQYSGLIYKNEVNEPLRYGQSLQGYIKPIREDKKIDVSIYPIGHKSIEPNAASILAKLQERDGFLPFNDKSDPTKIFSVFGISKKLFKKSIGALYRDQLIRIEGDGIYLADRENGD